jgi:hypothetical protein
MKVAMKTISDSKYLFIIHVLSFLLPWGAASVKHRYQNSLHSEINS